MTVSRRFALNLKNLLLTGLVGWITALYTLWHRAKVQAGLELGQSFCNLSEKINCDNVALSKYSEIAGVSVPTLGLIFFVIVILLAMRALRQNREGGIGDLTRKLLLLTASIGVLSSFGFFFISSFKIGSYCLVCILVYFLSFLNFYFTWQVSKEVLKSPLKKDSLNAGFILLVLALIAAQFVFDPMATFAAKNGKEESEESVPSEILNQAQKQYNNESSYEIPDQQSPIFGTKDAKVSVVEFSDFKCPHCAHNHKSMPQAIESLGPQVRVIYKNFPLDPACNTGGMHAGACFAAWAARCVYKKTGPDAFKKMQDYLFENGETFTDKSVKEKAASLGMSESDLDTCIQSNETVQEIHDEVELAKSIGVDGTPAIFVNGKRLQMGANTPVLKAIIRKLLSGR